MPKKEMNLKSMLLLTLAAFGIQFGSALQMTNMGSIYKYLGVNVDNMAILWLAAPITGLFAQPIIGFMSDRTWRKFLPGRLGRRQPYILIYTLLACIALLLMPNSSSILMAAFLLWVLDLSLNGATEPFRAMLGDFTLENKMTKIFALQTIFAGCGAMLADAMPWIMVHVFHMAGTQSGNDIPFPITLSFYIGAGAFLLFVLITIATNKEKPPQATRKQARLSVLGALKELTHNIIHMPRVIRIFWIPQLFTWFGLFSMWLYFGLGIAQNIYGLPASAAIQGHPLFSKELLEGVAWGGICFATYQGVSCLFAFLLPTIARRIGGKTTYGLTLIMGGIGLVSALFVRDPYFLLLCMVGVGVAWAGIMTMPYSIIAAAISQRKRGVYMGIFNITITVPQIICALVLSVITQYFFHNHAMKLVGLGGACMLVGGCLMVLIQWREKAKS